MMSFDRALKIALQKNPDRHFTGLGYKYNNGYYLELKADGGSGAAVDSMFRVDMTTAEVTSYNPMLDGVIMPWDTEPITDDIQSLF